MLQCMYTHPLLSLIHAPYTLDLLCYRNVWIYRTGLRENAEIYQLEGFWRSGANIVELHWLKETRRVYDATTQHSNEMAREIKEQTRLDCPRHHCGSLYLFGSLRVADEATSYWLLPPGSLNCRCGCRCCCTCRGLS